MAEDAHNNFPFWQGKYTEGHMPWDLGEVSGAVRALVEGYFPPAGQVLVPGCGRGHDALYLATLGYQVTAVDFVPDALEALREMAAEVGVKLAVEQRDLLAGEDAFTDRFDLILENAFLCALMPDKWPFYEPFARRVLKPGGKLLGVFMEVTWKGGPPFNCPPERLFDLFPENHWRREGPWPQPRDPRRPGREYLAILTRIG